MSMTISRNWYARYSHALHLSWKFSVYKKKVKGCRSVNKLIKQNAFPQNAHFSQWNPPTFRKRNWTRKQLVKLNYSTSATCVLWCMTWIVYIFRFFSWLVDLVGLARRYTMLCIVICITCASIVTLCQSVLKTIWIWLVVNFLWSIERWFFFQIFVIYCATRINHNSRWNRRSPMA